MTLRGNAGRLVQGVNNLSGFVSLTEGPGIEIIPNNARNSLQFGTVTSMLEFDDILANGDSTARSAKFLNNASDTIPALIVHNTLDFGNGVVNPGVTLKYSPGTPDGLVIGPTTGTDKKILRTDLLGANTSTAIVAKSGMTFDTGLTLTVDNLVAQTVSSNGDIAAHRLLPIDTTGLTINLDTCTMSCADSVANPRINIQTELNCSRAITGSAGMTLTGELSLNSTIITPSLIVPIDLTLKPSGDVRVFSGKTLFCDILSQNDTNRKFNITAIGTNKNIRITPSGTGRTYLGGSGIMIGYISNYYASDITIQPDSAKIILAAPVIATNINATNITTSANTNLNITPGTSGSTNINSALIVRDSLTVDTITSRTANTNLALSATGTGTINLNSAVVGTNITTNVLTSPATVNLSINSPGGTINTNATNITASGALSLASNGALNLQAFTGNSSVNISASGSGVINMSNPLLVNTIVPYNSSNLSLAASGVNGNVNLTATGTGTIRSNSPLTVSTIISPAVTNLSLTANGSINLAATGTGTINLNSPTVGTTITATTFTAPPNTNLNINALGGSIITNAIQLAPTTSLTIAPATSLTFTPGLPTQFNCSVNVANDLTVTGSLNGTGLTNTITNGNLTLTPNGIGLVRIASGKTFATDAISSNAATTIAIKNDITFDVTKTLTVDNIISKSITNNGDIIASKIINRIADGLIIDLDNSTLSCGDTTLPILIEPHLQLDGTLTCTSNAIVFSGLATTTLTPYNSTGLTINLNNSTLSSATPISMGSIVANTISSDAATNLTINSPGGTINTNATSVTASGALSLASNGNLNLQASTGNSSVNISPSGSGVINMLGSLLVNTIIPYNSADLTLAASGINGNIALTATGTGTIKCNSSLTASTLTSPAATNLAINTPGGTINTNATNITASGALTLATTNARLTLNAGTNIVYVSSPATFNNSIACSSFSNGVNNNIVMTPLTGTITLSTNNANNININPGGLTSFGGSGINLPNGGSTLNWYEEYQMTGSWIINSATFPCGYCFIRIGKMVSIFGENVTASIPSAINFSQTYSTTIPSQFRPSNVVIANFNTHQLTIQTNGSFELKIVATGALSVRFAQTITYSLLVYSGGFNTDTIV